MQQYTDGLERALGSIYARSQADLTLVRERADAAIAAANAKVADAIDGLTRSIERRLADLKDGTDGASGKDGERGAPGERGPEGPTGKLPIVRAWEDGVQYEGAVVTHGGSTWQAQRDTGREPPHEDWICLARGGSDGRSFVVRGTWAEGETYRELDVVALGGASFAARRDDPGVCPGDGWQLIAAQGKRGNAGERGAAVKGDRGEPGAQPVAMDVDDQGLLTLRMADGSMLSCDLYPLLVKLI